jgi:hypothetical protein
MAFCGTVSDRGAVVHFGALADDDAPAEVVAAYVRPAGKGDASGGFRARRPARRRGIRAYAMGEASLRVLPYSFSGCRAALAC